MPFTTFRTMRMSSAANASSLSLARLSAPEKSVNIGPWPGITSATSSSDRRLNVARCAANGLGSIACGTTKPKPFSHSASAEIRIRNFGEYKTSDPMSCPGVAIASHASPPSETASPAAITASQANRSASWSAYDSIWSGASQFTRAGCSSSGIVIEQPGCAR